MAEDASLDDFLSESGDEAEESPSDGEMAADDDTTPDESESQAAETPARATTTYAWDGDGAACGSCGDVVETRWQQDGTLVCADCKDWSG